MGEDVKPTPRPWYVRDLRATEMRRLGWEGPSVDTILITSEDGKGILACEGQNCIIARIEFKNRPEELGESNLADAEYLVHCVNSHDDLQAKASLYPELVEALRLAQEAVRDAHEAAVLRGINVHWDALEPNLRMMHDLISAVLAKVQP